MNWTKKWQKKNKKTISHGMMKKRKPIFIKFIQKITAKRQIK